MTARKTAESAVRINKVPKKRYNDAFLLLFDARKTTVSPRHLFRIEAIGIF